MLNESRCAYIYTLPELLCILVCHGDRELLQSVCLGSRAHLTSVLSARFLLGFILHPEPLLDIRHLFAHLILAFHFQLTQICSITGLSLLFVPLLFSGSLAKMLHHLFQLLSAPQYRPLCSISRGFPVLFSPHNTLYHKIEKLWVSYHLYIAFMEQSISIYHHCHTSKNI